MPATFSFVGLAQGATNVAFAGDNPSRETVRILPDLDL
jgi:hypothetical protein